MPTTSTTKYYKIIGSQLNDDTSIDYVLREVADWQGTATGIPAPIMQRFTTQPGANELPRGTIVKVVTTNTITFTVNPTGP